MPENWRFEANYSDGVTVFQHKKQPESVEARYDFDNDRATCIHKHPSGETRISSYKGANCQYLALVDALHWMENHPRGRRSSGEAVETQTA